MPSGRHYLPEYVSWVQFRVVDGFVLRTGSCGRRGVVSGRGAGFRPGVDFEGGEDISGVEIFARVEGISRVADLSLLHTDNLGIVFRVMVCA
jgi:hypothetical protein